MTYLVLARKWRPRSFDTLVGQDHVVRALTHALSTQRLHHAWLFTGTRGVGKTTLSRILAKSLNCESGITATPCGTCQACMEIDAGRFVDYVELDAASNRGVDEMTQLLEQAVYAPSSGRFKVYMIDEVHMLTGHAFNAMLKTLEEPPPHVKFILATTDPQKIPVTVLSRCLQFNLKQMAAESIVAHLQNILHQEAVPFQVPALRLLARAAAGSMRDALSLTDQAIAYSAGNLTAEAVQGMMGTIDQGHLVALLQALAVNDASQVLNVANQLASRGFSYSGALADLAVLLSRVAIEQRVRGSVPADDPLADDIQQLAQTLHADQIQLFYTVAVHSRSELSLAPDEYAGFVMACLRMLALVPPGSVPQAQGITDPASMPAREPVVPQSAPVAAPPPAASQATPQAALEPASDPVSQPALPPQVSAAPEPPPWDEPAAEPSIEPANMRPAPAPAHSGQKKPAETTESPEPEITTDHPDQGVAAGANDFDGFEPVDDFDTSALIADFSDDFDVPATVAGLADVAAEPKRSRSSRPSLTRVKASDWPQLAASLPVTGLASELARQSEWLGLEGDHLVLRVAIRSLAESAAQVRLQTVLSEHFGTVVKLRIQVGATGDDTAHAVAQARKAALQQQAERAVQNDPFVQVLLDQFDARIVPGSIRPAADQQAA